ncbi:MAG: intermembrane transport protein PqiB [Oleispira sp.]
MSLEQRAQFKESSSWSPIWLVPIVAFLLGVWMVFSYINNLGPEITISFATAEGLEAGKTRIKARNVDIGIVETVMLNDSMDGVVVTVRLDKSVTKLLNQGARFWVVKPRIGSAGISGLGTLLSGAYIELSPGKSSETQRQFEGLEDVPLTTAGTPGLALSLFNDDKHELSVGDPVLYRGFKVGQVEEAQFDPKLRRVHYRLFINAPYDQLITENTYFWNVGGIELDATVNGINISAGTIESLISGGVTFDVPPDLPRGKSIQAEREYQLYRNKQSAFERRYQFYAEYLLLLEDSVRGLVAGAPVEYRGIRLGTVTEVGVEDIKRSEKNESDRLIPVLVHLEPGRIGYGDNAEALTKFKKDFVYWIKEGISARLNTGNIITGKQFVDLNFHDNLTTNFPEKHGRFDVIPTSNEGFGQITAKVEKILDKIQQLPLKPLIEHASTALVELNQTMQGLQLVVTRADEILAHEDVSEIPSSLNNTLKELNQTIVGLGPNSESYRNAAQTLSDLNKVLRDVQPLLRELNNKPSALLFSQPKGVDLEPSFIQ